LNKASQCRQKNLKFSKYRHQSEIIKTVHLKENNTGIQDVETPKHLAEDQHRRKIQLMSAALDTTISHHEWHEYFNSLANSPLPIQLSCKGPNAATHDQEVDETQTTEDTNRRL